MSRSLHFLVVGNVARTNLNSWRAAAPGAPLPGSLAYMVEEARVLEESLMDGLFLTDTLFFGDPGTWPYRTTDDFDPFTLGAALSMVTTRLGIVATGSTTFEAPYNLARSVLSLDHLSAGRAGWNVVTTWAKEAADNFGSEGLMDHDERYRKAAEAVQVILDLWSSIDAGAVKADKSSGVFTEREGISVADHHGNYYDVKGPLGARPSPQSRPVLFQAGSSGAGVAFAAAVAEVVFTMQGSLQTAVDFRSRVAAESRRLGRTFVPLVTPQLSYVVGSTQEEADRLNAWIDELLVPDMQIAKLLEVDIDLREAPLDGPVPEFPESTETNQSALARYRQIAQADGMTVRRFLVATASGFGKRVVATPEKIADLIEEWFLGGGADGFVLAPNLPGQSRVFGEQVVPILQERGLFRREYAGATLREHLELPAPADQRA